MTSTTTANVPLFNHYINNTTDANQNSFDTNYSVEYQRDEKIYQRDIKDPYKIPDVNKVDRIIDIKILKKNKVVAVYFDHIIKYNRIKCKNGDKAVPVYAMSKAVTREDDTFDMEKGVFIALAKYMFPGLYTPDGYEEIAKQLSFRKDYNKYIKAAIKKASKKREEEKKARAKEIENQKIIARKKEKNKIRKNKMREMKAEKIKAGKIDLLKEVLLSE